tara:strand:+ start:554 stop:1081 length:528 start_codon:yes stop_codon:yes gene_type:complete
MSCCKDKKTRSTTKPKLGGWSINPEVYKFIKDNLPKGSTILELGSGWGTEVLSKDYTMISIEHDERFVGKYTSTYIHAPMLNGWYDKSVLETKLEALRGTYQMILIDGPIGSESNGRIGFYENIQLFDDDLLMVFTDTNRAGESTTYQKVAIHKFTGEIPLKYEHFKTFSVIHPY